MKIIHEPKIELTTDEMCAMKKVLSLLDQIYKDGEAPMDNDAEDLQLRICDFAKPILMVGMINKKTARSFFYWDLLEGGRPGENCIQKYFQKPLDFLLSWCYNLCVR